MKQQQNSLTSGWFTRPTWPKDPLWPPSSHPGTGPDVSGEKILLVDDNLANMKVVTFVLIAKGYDVRQAYSADEALTSIEKEYPDLVLMDIQLPGMDGLTLTRNLKASPSTRDLIIVALTAYAMRGDEEKAFEAGCSGYLTKPIDTRTFADVIAGFLGARP